VFEKALVYSSVGAGRSEKRLAEEYDDADLALNAIKLESRALAAIQSHQSELGVA
jgi:hypothetical protein